MKFITGHQPVYLPWLGLFHKIALADEFVYMDDVQYLRQDWNNRNKIRIADGWTWVTVPVRLKQSKSELLKDIRVDTEGFGGKNHWQTQHWNSLQSAYRKARYWDRYAPWLEDFYLHHRWEYLAELNLHMLRYLLEELGIHPELHIASEVGFSGEKSDLVLDHCHKLDADVLILGTLGRDYIVEEDFISEGVSLYYQHYRHPEYSQRFRGFEPYMTVFDLLFNHGPEARDILLGGNITRDELAQRAMRVGRPAVLNEEGD